ncbi:MAG: YggS family pyridoxal phosphate-dependent enzyme [Brevinema sp.]
MKSHIPHLCFIFEKIQEAKNLSGRSNDHIDLLAVVKNQPIDKIKLLIDNNMKIIGENKIQDASILFPQLQDYSIEKHLIGSLQSNKENKAIELFDTIQSIESLSQLKRITEKIQKYHAHKNIFIQVNTSHEDTKHGVSNLTELFDMVEYSLLMSDYISFNGLMTIGSLSHDEKIVRKSFVELRILRDDLLIRFPEILGLKLSMGMSNDFHWAIQEGSDIVRLGRLLFNF